MDKTVPTNVFRGSKSTKQTKSQKTEKRREREKIKTTAWGSKNKRKGGNNERRKDRKEGGKG